ncbi:hypothetical protein DWX77_16515, partial [Blautia obeum]
MKKKNIIISIACSIFFIICVGAAIILFPKVKIISIACSIFFIICVGAAIILFPKVKEETIA